ncbi:putative reverse transcriptase domain-containing protein [Tanacetum coccineum]
MGSNSEPPGYAAIDDDVESDLESTARSEPNGPSNEENPDIAAIIAQQLQTILPQIVTQVTNNVNNANANGRNSRNGGKMDVPTRHSWHVIPKSMMEKEFYPSNEIEKLENEFWNHKMVGANHAAYTDRFHELAKLVPHLVTPESSRIKRVGILTDEAVSYGTLMKGNENRKGVEKTSKPGGS